MNKTKISDILEKTRIKFLAMTKTEFKKALNEASKTNTGKTIISAFVKENVR